MIMSKVNRVTDFSNKQTSLFCADFFQLIQLSDSITS